ERENDEGKRGEGKIEGDDPFLERDAQLEIDLGNAGQRFAKNGEIEGENDGDPEPEKQKERDDIFRPPVAILGHAVGVTESAGEPGGAAEDNLCFGEVTLPAPEWP